MDRGAWLQSMGSQGFGQAEQLHKDKRVGPSPNLGAPGLRLTDTGWEGGSAL